MFQINGKNPADIMVNGKHVSEIQMNGKTVYSSQIPAWIGFQATAGDNTLHLMPQTKGFYCTIDWGDGSKTTAPVHGGNVIHSYASAGLYDIKVRGKSFAGFYVNNQAGKEKYVVAYSMGKWAVDTMISCNFSFYGCNNLITIRNDIFRYNTAVTAFYSCFWDCTGLTTLPPEIFRYNTAVTTFYSCFRNCTGLTTLPLDIFRYNTRVGIFTSCFWDCTGLTTLPPDLFRYNTAVTTFYNCFDGCTKLTLRNDIFGTDYTNRFNGKIVDFTSFCYRSSFKGTQGTAPALWSFTGLTATKTSCFGGAGNSATSLSNYNTIPAEWRYTGGP